MQTLFCTRKEAAQTLTVSLRTIDNLIAAGVVKPVRIGRRVLIPWTQLEALKRRSEVSTAVAEYVREGGR